MKYLQPYIYYKNRLYRFYYLSAVILILLSGSCKKQLDVKDPNDPTFGVNVQDEAGITAYAKGGVYWNGFNYGDVWLGDSYFSLPWGYHELMGDVIGGGQGSNNQTTTIGVPDQFQADPNDPSTIFTNTAPQALSIIRGFNNTGATASGNNAVYYEWVNMYAMINACNLTLEHLPGIGLTMDKANTVMAWAYWWKGYAYAQIGTLYYSGLIIDQSSTIVSNYVDHAAIIEESNKNLNQALTILKSISNTGEFSAIIAQLIPLQNQVGIGMPFSDPEEWENTINTMLARNILLNHLAPFVNKNPNATISKSSITPMTTADWQSVINYCQDGIKEKEHVFTGRTVESNSYFSPGGGSVAAILAASNQTTTYKLGERLVQQFKAGDKRRANFSTSNGTFFGDANTNSTRYSLVDGVDSGFTGLPNDFPILGSRQSGELEIYIGPTYEENALMLAEANIRTGNIETGLGYIDAVRNYQHAGVAPVKGTGLTLITALQELTMERLAGLALRGLSFYDSRRWGWTYSIANGGGRYGCNIIYQSKLYTNATINYNFMDYWDVPADETDKNPPADGSAVVINPNY
jgi:starch-binding outer membrane protein, SusD/RagB family